MPFSRRILIVDDDPAVLMISASLLRDRGYEVKTAQDGFAALVELRSALPDILISDLRMPNMSGFELLSVVRRRFPQVTVIVMSGEFEESAPAGLLTDAFLYKGDYSPDKLVAQVTELIERSPLRSQPAKKVQSPVWIPKNAAGFFVVTRVECLRSFPIAADVDTVEI